jgi:hypothetical protein
VYGTLIPVLHRGFWINLIVFSAVNRPIVGPAFDWLPFDASAINPLPSAARTVSIYFHNQFDVFHS